MSCATIRAVQRELSQASARRCANAILHRSVCRSGGRKESGRTLRGAVVSVILRIRGVTYRVDCVAAFVQRIYGGAHIRFFFFSAPFGACAQQKKSERKPFSSCNPARLRDEKWDVEIDLPTGPELVPARRFWKAGTATSSCSHSFDVVR